MVTMADQVHATSEYQRGLATAAKLCRDMGDKWSYARKVATLCAEAIEKEMKNVPPQLEAQPQSKKETQ